VLSPVKIRGLFRFLLWFRFGLPLRVPPSRRLLPLKTVCLVFFFSCGLVSCIRPFPGCSMFGSSVVSLSFVEGLSLLLFGPPPSRGVEFFVGAALPPFRLRFFFKTSFSPPCRLSPPLQELKVFLEGQIEISPCPTFRPAPRYLFPFLFVCR